MVSSDVGKLLFEKELLELELRSDVTNVWEVDGFIICGGDGFMLLSLLFDFGEEAEISGWCCCCAAVTFASLFISSPSILLLLLT